MAEVKLAFSRQAHSKILKSKLLTAKSIIKANCMPVDGCPNNIERSDLVVAAAGCSSIEQLVAAENRQHLASDT